MTTPEMEQAKDRLATAITGLDLTEAEVRTVTWLTRWDATMVNNLASVIEKARVARYDEYRRLIDSGVRTPEVVDRIASLHDSRS